MRRTTSRHTAHPRVSPKSPRGRQSRAPRSSRPQPVSCSLDSERQACSRTATAVSRPSSIGGEPFGVVSLHVDRLGRLWIIGVGRLRAPYRQSVDSPVWSNDTKVAPSLVGANVRCMVEDASGNFYFGTTSGIIEVDPRTGDTRRYTTAEGLAQNEVWSALASRRGDIWFGTIAGVSRLDATRARPRTSAPRALITTVHVNGVARLVSELGDHEVSELTLAPSERGVAIGFFALTFASGEHLRYQYRLEGAET